MTGSDYAYVITAGATMFALLSIAIHLCDGVRRGR